GPARHPAAPGHPRRAGRVPARAAAAVPPGAGDHSAAGQRPDRAARAVRRARATRAAREELSGPRHQRQIRPAPVQHISKGSGTHDDTEFTVSRIPGLSRHPPGGRRRAGRLTMLAGTTLLAVATVAGPATAAGAAPAAAGTGWVRCAHLSPNTPAVDVYMYSFGDPKAMVVLKHVSYGAVSEYMKVKAGESTPPTRPAAAAASTKPVLSANIMVHAGHAYTVAGMGPAKGLRLQVLDD